MRSSQLGQVSIWAVFGKVRIITLSRQDLGRASKQASQGLLRQGARDIEDHFIKHFTDDRLDREGGRVCA